MKLFECVEVVAMLDLFVQALQRWHGTCYNMIRHERK